METRQSRRAERDSDGEKALELCPTSALSPAPPQMGSQLLPDSSRTHVRTEGCNGGHEASRLSSVVPLQGLMMSIPPAFAHRSRYLNVFSQYLSFCSKTGKT